MPSFTTKWVLFGLLALALSLFQGTASGTEVDARAEVAAALYAASATQAAAEKQSDAKLKALRKSIDQLQEKVRGGVAEAAGLRSDLALAQERFVAELAQRDRAYSESIAVFRAAVQDIAATPEGAAALARFNAGDEPGALAILDDLRKARDAAREKRAQIESAAEARRIATLALDARAKGKVTTAQVIGRYEEVTKLDPGVPWDWVELGRLYQSAGRLADAKEAAQHAAATGKTERDQSVALIELGDVQAKQGDLAGARASYRKALEIAERLAAGDAGNTDWQRDLSVSYEKVGDVQAKQGDLAGAVASYRKAQGIARSLGGARFVVTRTGSAPVGELQQSRRRAGTARDLGPGRSPPTARRRPFERSWRRAIRATRTGSAMCQSATTTSATCR